MAESSIPVDLFNPGQVFACLGFLEAADMLCGNAEGGFDWSNESDVKFCLRTAGNENPFKEVLAFLAEAKFEPETPENRCSEEERLEQKLCGWTKSKVFPSVLPDKDSALPVRIIGKNKKQIVLGHWADGSSRNKFKLYAGNRSALGIATVMQESILELWKSKREKLTTQPFDITTSMSGSFNFDPRGAWTTIDAGYSPNRQGHRVEASPVVEILAAWGLENARPDEFEVRKVRYAAWGLVLPPILARVALIGGVAVVPMKRFRFKLYMSGKNKIVTFAEQEVDYG
ncbi:MAG: type I-U CRISPR-associated protein Cas8c [Candidatus Dadabacteria bacterium]|nr:type I-U CRISPR-associated protein Cas8c [Candidatus Dadabacteria bacterium]